MPQTQQSKTHLMIVHPRYASMIMTGQKIIEARLGVDRRAPYDRVTPGDTIYIKPTSQRVIGKAIVHRVDQYEGLTPQDIEHLRGLYQERVMDDDACWQAKADASYASFITLGRVTILRDESTVPAELLSPSRNAWRTLNSGIDAARRAA